MSVDFPFLASGGVENLGSASALRHDISQCCSANPIPRFGSGNIHFEFTQDVALKIGATHVQGSHRCAETRAVCLSEMFFAIHQCKYYLGTCVVAHSNSFAARTAVSFWPSRNFCAML